MHQFSQWPMPLAFYIFKINSEGEMTMVTNTVEGLAKKILLPQNKAIRKYAQKWVEDSIPWANKQVAEEHGAETDVGRITELTKRYRPSGTDFGTF